MPTNKTPLDSVEVASLTHELSRENKADSLVVTELRPRVANAFGLYANYTHYHWQTYAPLFRDMQKLFDRLANDVLGTLDEFAERVRMIGQDPPAHLIEASGHAGVGAAAPHSTVREMVEEAHRHHSGPSTPGRSLIKRSLVLGLGVLVLGYAAGCGGSPPADTARQTPEPGTDSGAPTVQEGAQIAQDVGASSITGTVIFDGTVPALRPLAMEAEPVCHEMHSGKPVPNEMLVLGSGNSMGNIMVWVSNGLPAGKSWPAPQTPVVLDQKGCQYVPHVSGIMAGQPYRILNSDGILHNIHTLPKINPSLNRGQPATVKEMTTSFPKPEGMFQIKCDVHPWMSAYMGVFTHPFFSVTGTDGKYTISGLAPGTYEITAWHERLGTQTASLTVGANDTKTQNFKFTTT